MTDPSPQPNGSPTDDSRREEPSRDASDVIRLTVHYSGRVQGVGFRQTTARIASRFEVQGFVENLPDGRVRLVVEGDREDVTVFAGSLATTMVDYIASQQRRETLATGEFVRFFIKRRAW